jgi:hypothetical protein
VAIKYTSRDIRIRNCTSGQWQPSFDLTVFPTIESVYISLTVLLDSKNVGVTVEVLVLSCTQAGVNLTTCVLPVKPHMLRVIILTLTLKRGVKLPPDM